MRGFFASLRMTIVLLDFSNSENALGMMFVRREVQSSPDQKTGEIFRENKSVSMESMMRP